MKIALCTTFSPFVVDDDRKMVERIKTLIEKMGHQAEIIYLPVTGSPDTIFQEIVAFRWVDLSVADRIICFALEACLIPHSYKIVWLLTSALDNIEINHSQYDAQDTEVRHCFSDAVNDAYTKALSEANRVYTHSSIISKRLEEAYSIKSDIIVTSMPESFEEVLPRILS